MFKRRMLMLFQAGWLVGLKLYLDRLDQRCQGKTEYMPLLPEPLLYARFGLFVQGLKRLQTLP
jgi:hypothetical protein